jgi:hypothetical protein
MTIKIRSTHFFGGKVSRRPHAKGFYGMLKNLAKYDRDTTSAKFKGISRQLSFATRCVCWYFAESSGRRIRSDYNSDADAQYIRKGPQCIGRFIRYYPVTVASKQ